MSIIKPSLQQVFIEGAHASANDFNVSPFNQLNAAALAYAKKRGAELVGMKYAPDGRLIENPNAEWAITDTTRRELRNLESQAFEDGWTPDELATAIMDLIDDPARAEMIARTELANAQIEGSLAEWRESEVVTGKVWLVAEDPCDICTENADDGVIGIDDSFSSGDDAPGAHPNCYCDCAPIVEGQEE